MTLETQFSHHLSADFITRSQASIGQNPANQRYQFSLSIVTCKPFV
jgi:hypothetical protein